MPLAKYKNIIPFILAPILLVSGVYLSVVTGAIKKQPTPIIAGTGSTTPIAVVPVDTAPLKTGTDDVLGKIGSTNGVTYYAYKSGKSSGKVNEVMGKRTPYSYTVSTDNKHFTTTFTFGAPMFEQVSGQWFDVAVATTTDDNFSKQIVASTTPVTILMSWLFPKAEACTSPCTLTPSTNGYFDLAAQATFATAHDGSTANATLFTGSDTQNWMRVRVGVTYDILRSGYCADFSGIAGGSTVTATNLIIYTDFTNESFNDSSLGYISAVSFAPSNVASLAAGDFDKSKWGTTEYSAETQITSFNGAGSPGNNTIVFNSSGKTYVQGLIGTTGCVGLREGHDIQNVSPGVVAGDNTISEWYVSSAHQPSLVVTFTAPSGGFFYPAPF